MSEYGSVVMPPSTRELSRKAAIVGIGETDYKQDYMAARAKAPGYEPPTTESLTITAFERALADAGLKREDIDGLTVSFMYAGPSPAETAAFLGLKPRYQKVVAGIMAGPLPQVCAAIEAGECDTVVMVYAAASRAIGRKFGGVRADDNPDKGTPAGYYYYHPWGWSAPAAYWAMVWNRYRDAYGVTEADLGSVAMQFRKNAMANPDAIMQAPMTIEDYLASRYVVAPMHLFDMCLVNDGAVCLIVRRADLAKDMPHAPVEVAGWGEAKIKTKKLEGIIRDRMRPQFQESARQALEMAGMDLKDIQHFEGYDSSSMHLINHLEGHGFVAPGEGLDFFKSGHAAVGGSLPINTAGGMLSGAYMHGWNHVVEVTRQLRHEAGARTVKDVQISMSSLAQTDQVHPLIFTRGAE